MLKYANLRFALTCVAIVVLCGASLTSLAGGVFSSKSGGDETSATAFQTDPDYVGFRILTVGKSAIQLFSRRAKDWSIRLNRTDVSSFRELVKKFSAWSDMAEQYQLSGIQKTIKCDGIVAEFVTLGQEVNGKPTVSCFLNLQGHSWAAEDLRWCVKNLELIPKLDQQIDKADKLLK